MMWRGWRRRRLEGAGRLGGAALSGAKVKGKNIMDPSDCAVIKRFAAKYVWWKTLDEALRQPDRIIAQVMNIGDYDDVVELVEQIGEDRLRRVLTHAEIGQFNGRSWTYWHYRLGLARPNQAVPALPKRRLG